jgi:hypothetical protein
VKELGDQAIVEFRPKQEGNTLHLILAPPKVQPGQKPPKSDSGPKGGDSGARRDSGPNQSRGQQPAAAQPAAQPASQPAQAEEVAAPQPTGTSQS